MRTRRRHGFVALIAVLLTFGLLAPANAAGTRADDTKRRKQQVDASIDALKHDLAETSRELAQAAIRLRRAQAGLPAAREAVAKTQGELVAARARDAALADRLAMAKLEEQRAQRELEGVVDSMLESKDLIGRIARNAYQTGRVGEVAVMLEADSPDDFATRLILVQSAMRSQNAALGRLSEQRADLDAHRATLAAKKAEIAKLKAEAAENVRRKQKLAQQAAAAKTRVDQLVAEAAAAKAAVEREKASEERRYAEMQAESRRLQDLLRARARAAQEAERRRAAASRGGNRSSGGSSNSSGSSSAGSSYVGGSGELARPISGRISSPYGMRVHPVTGIYKLHDGTDFAAPCGKAIHAAESGVVVWATFLNGYGNQLAIDHGTVRGVQLATSYSHQSRFAVGVGAQVRRGQVIGYVGSTGYSTGCHLHFMVYANGNTVNPMGWL